MKNHIIKKLVLSMVLTGTAAPFAYSMRRIETISTSNIIDAIEKCVKTINFEQFEQAKTKLTLIHDALIKNNKLITKKTRTQWEELKNKTLTKQSLQGFKNECQNVVTKIDNLLLNKNTTKTVTLMEFLNNNNSNKTKEVPLPSRVEVPTKNVAQKNLKHVEIIEKNLPVHELQVLTQEVEQKVIENNNQKNQTELIRQSYLPKQKEIDNQAKKVETVTHLHESLTEPKIVIEKKVDTSQVNNQIEVKQPEDILEIKEIIDNNIGEKIDESEEEIIPDEELIEIEEENVLNGFVIDIIKNNKLKEPQNLTIKDKNHVTFLKLYAKELQTLKSVIELKQGAHVSKKTLDEAYYNLYRIKLLTSKFVGEHVTEKTVANLFKHAFQKMIDSLMLCVDTMKDLFVVNSVVELVTLFQEICVELDIDPIKKELTLKLETLNKDYTEELTEYEKENIQTQAQLKNKVNMLIDLFNNKKTEQKVTPCFFGNKESSKLIISTVKNRNTLFTTVSRNLIITALLDVLKSDNIPNKNALLKAAAQALNYCSGKNYFNMSNRYELKK